MDMKLFDSELRVMEVLWKEGDVTAKRVAEALGEQIGWSKTTTYTVIKKCIDKGAIRRAEPNFICSPLISREQVRERETTELIDRLYGGAADQLVASLLGSRRLAEPELERLKQLVRELR